jgi:DNA-binding HxlR family transcriptional regulator
MAVSKKGINECPIDTALSVIDGRWKGTIPPCVHYSISEYGMTLGPVLKRLCDWGRKHMARNISQASSRAAAPTRPAVPPSSAGSTRSPRRKSSPA